MAIPTKVLLQVVAAGTLVFSGACSSTASTPPLTRAEAQRALCDDLRGLVPPKGEPPSGDFPESLLQRLEADADLFDRAGHEETATELRAVISSQRAIDAAIRDKTALAVFLDDSVSTSQRLSIETAISQAQGVISVIYVSKAEAYALFKRSFADYPELVSKVSTDALPASFRVRVSGPDAFDRGTELAQSMPGVESALPDLTDIAFPAAVRLEALFDAIGRCQSPGPSLSP